jgi:hypothetical protein
VEAERIELPMASHSRFTADPHVPHAYSPPDESGRRMSVDNFHESCQVGFSWSARIPKTLKAAGGVSSGDLLMDPNGSKSKNRPRYPPDSRSWAGGRRWYTRTQIFLRECSYPRHSTATRSMTALRMVFYVLGVTCEDFRVSL